MTVQITVPELGESVVEATVGEWHKEQGESVASGDLLVDLETDKVDIEIGAETTGVLVSIERRTGEDVQIGDVLANIDPDGALPAEQTIGEEMQKPATPVAQRLAEDRDLDLAELAGSGPKGRITRQDVEEALKQREAPPGEEADKDAVPPFTQPDRQAAAGRGEERVRLSRRRRTIAQRLVEAQQTAAMLTTFNDVDMSAIMDIRKRRGESFQERHGAKLGFTSFFVKASVGALKAFPRLNAEIERDQMVLKHYHDIGIAVGAEDGLVVPVIRDADTKSIAEIEREIRGLIQKARDGSLTLEDIRGGTFTITNGGVFGSLLSTPILNPPQVGILGLHRIEDRPIALKGELVIRPMMYMALSYDHRLIDGREAVQFLSRVKELIEEPEKLLLET